MSEQQIETFDASEKPFLDSAAGQDSHVPTPEELNSWAEEVKAMYACVEHLKFPQCDDCVAHIACPARNYLKSKQRG